MTNNNTKRQNQQKGQGGTSAQIEMLPVSSLVPYARNSRTHSDSQIAQIAASIKEFGFCNPVLIDKNGGIIAGHGRVMAATLLGMETVPCLRLSHLTEAQRRAYVIADNQLALNSGWDETILASELAELDGLEFDTDVLGFDDAFLASLGDDPEPVAAEDAEPQIDRAEELRGIWKTEAGQLWSLGRHRLLCGDSRSSEQVSRLLSGVRINLAFTSPPYASQRKYDESSGFKPIPPDEFVQWFESIAENVRQHVATDGSWFVNIKEHCEDGQRSLYVKDLVIAHVRLWNWKWIDEFVWKRGGVPGKWNNRFKNQWEPIFHFSASAQLKMRHENVMHASDGAFQYSPDNPKSKTGFFSNRGRSDIASDGMALPGNVLEIGAEGKQTEVHTAAFPVGLPEWFIKAYTDEGDNIFEPFCGSGSTLIAAENTGRICYAIEISPAYVAVILQRFQDATGVTPTLVGDV